MAATYYSRRSARDPDWREQVNRARRERERRQREEDPERFRAVNRRGVQNCRARQRASGRTFRELWLRVGGERETLRRILREEIERGTVEYHSTSRRYVLNGALDPEVREALLDLEL